MPPPDAERGPEGPRSDQLARQLANTPKGIRAVKATDPSGVLLLPREVAELLARRTAA